MATSPKIPEILVIGGTGAQGKPVVEGTHLDPP
jgi:hypothetical protein